MIENRAVGTNDDIHPRKHAPQGNKVTKNLILNIKKVKKLSLFLIFNFNFFLIF